MDKQYLASCALVVVFVIAIVVFGTVGVMIIVDLAR